MLTRPLGASAADWLGKPKLDGGVGAGSGPVTLVLAAALACLVASIAVRRQQRQAMPLVSDPEVS